MATVNMIDFAHVFPATEKDSNYTSGVEKLVKVLEEIMLE
jgi:Inositol polyphosphate kinase